MRGGTLFQITVLSYIFISPAVNAQDRELCIGPAGGEAGSRVTVPITVDNGDGLAGFQVDLRFDTNLLLLVGVRRGADTMAAGSWNVNNSSLETDQVRVLGFSGAGAALNSGFKELALIDFDVTASSSIQDVPFPLANCILGDSLGLGIPCRFCLQPGLEAAVPRFSTVLAGDSFLFSPVDIMIESGDWVLWRNDASVLAHTTTSGSPCSPDGLWDAGLLPGGKFSRRFQEPPGNFPYFCSPHCMVGHDGLVVVTDSIQLEAAESSGVLNLSWTGGSGLYRVHRSPNPRFVGPGQQVFPPDGGDTGITFSDLTVVEAGEILFFFVNNKN